MTGLRMSFDAIYVMFTNPLDALAQIHSSMRCFVPELSDSRGRARRRRFNESPSPAS
jgi:hypothetical protein